MKTKTKLEEYFENYMKAHGSELKHDSFESYIDKANDGPDSLNREIEKAYAGLGKQNKSALYDRGLLRSGYSDYLEKRAKSNYEKQSRELSDARDSISTSYVNGYKSYLDSLIKKNESFKTTVTKELIERGIAKDTDAVRYAMERGLSKKDAEAVARLSYTTLKSKLQKEIVNLAVRYEFDRTVAENMALSYGMTKTDAAMVGKIVANLTSRTPPFPTLADEYEDIAGKDSDSNLFKERNK